MHPKAPVLLKRERDIAFYRLLCATHEFFAAIRPLSFLMAVQVYLDSSDYSILSDARIRENRELRNVRHDLLDLRDASVCEFRYSYVHACEMVPVNPSALEAATRRLGLVQDLCGMKCLRSTDGLDRDELLAALSNTCTESNSERTYARNDNGNWLPEGHAFLDKHAEAFIAMAEAVRIEAGRRGIRDQKQVNLAVRFLLSEKLIKYSRDLPINQMGKDRVLRLAFERVSKESIVQSLLTGFGDLRTLANWAGTSPNGQQFTALLRDQALGPPAELERLRSLLGEFISSKECDRVGRQKGVANVRRGLLVGIREYRNLEILRLLDQNQEWFATKGFTRGNIEGINLAELSLPRLDNHLALYVENFRLNATTERNLLDAESDMADILHANYMPYVDIIRVDTFAGQVCKSQAKMLGVELVLDIRQLPDVIRRIAERV